MENGKHIGGKIRKIRELKGFSQEYMAQTLGISQRSYSSLEAEKTKLDWERIEEIAKTLEIEPVDLVSFDESFIFHHCKQSGNIIGGRDINNHFPEKLQEQYEKRISQLEDEVRFFRTQLEKKVG